MCALTSHQKPNIVLSILQNKCTRCRRGKIYRYNNPYDLRNFMKMNERCPVCAQPLDMEPGFYYGTNLVSYALAIFKCCHVCAVVGFHWIFFAGQEVLYVAISERFTIGYTSTTIDAAVKNNLAGVFCAIQCQLG